MTSTSCCSIYFIYIRISKRRITLTSSYWIFHRKPMPKTRNRQTFGITTEKALKTKTNLFQNCGKYASSRYNHWRILENLDSIRGFLFNVFLTLLPVGRNSHLYIWQTYLGSIIITWDTLKVCDIHCNHLHNIIQKGMESLLFLTLAITFLF